MVVKLNDKHKEDIAKCVREEFQYLAQQMLENPWDYFWMNPSDYPEGISDDALWDAVVEQARVEMAKYN